MSDWLEAIAGPVFVKEMRELARKRWFYALRMLQGVLLLGVALSVWSNFEGATFTSESYLMPRLANSLFKQVIEWQAVLAALVIPWLFTGPISSARNDGSLDLLLVSPLKNHEIVLGIFASRLILTLALIASGWPFLAIVMLFGGVAPETLMVAAGLLLIGSIAFAAVAIRFDVTSDTPRDAVVRAYALSATFLAMELLTPGLVTVFAEGLRANWRAPLCVLGLGLFLVQPLIKGIRAGVNGLREEAVETDPPTEPEPSKYRPFTPVEAPVDWNENASLLELAAKLRPPFWKSVWRIWRKTQEDGYRTWLIVIIVLDLVAFRVFHFESSVAWIGLCLLVMFAMTVLVAGSALFEKGGDLWEALLATPLDSKELLNLILRPLQSSFFVTGAFFAAPCIYRLGGDPPAAFASGMTGCLMIVQVFTLAVACRLGAKSHLEALAFPVGFVTIFAVGIHLLAPMVHTIFGAAVLLASLVLLLLGAKYWRRDWTGLNAICDLAIVYTVPTAVLVILPLAWTAPGERQPLAYADPLRWVGMTDSQAGYPLYNPAQFASCWMILGISILVGWLYIARQFDRLVGRTSGKARLPPLIKVS